MFVSSSIVASRIFALFVVKSTRLGGVAGGEPILAMPGFWELLLQPPLPKYLFVATGELSWGIRATVGTTAQLWISGASAGTSCPSSPSVSVNKQLGLTSWRYFDFDLEVEGWQIWHDGAIEVRRSNCDDIVLYTENVDSLRSSNQSLRPPGKRLD